MRLPAAPLSADRVPGGLRPSRTADDGRDNARSG
jgi:hypothetical protein